VKRKHYTNYYKKRCIPCDLAVAAGWLTYYYDNPSEAVVDKKKYLNGELTLRQLFVKANFNRDENGKLIQNYIKNNFSSMMDTYFSDW